MVQRSNQAAPGGFRMPATAGRSDVACDTNVLPVDQAAAALIARLSDRAAYATGEEYQEIRSLISALRQLCRPAT